MREGMDIDSSEFFERSLDKFAALRFNGDLPLSKFSGGVMAILKALSRKIKELKKVQLFPYP